MYSPSYSRLENWLGVRLLSCETTKGATTAINLLLFFNIENTPGSVLLCASVSCMLSMRDCCKVNNNPSDCTLTLHSRIQGIKDFFCHTISHLHVKARNTDSGPR
ncbi:hypothetical protein ILYODFUR_038882 [Ilyodon furcidens]|uniref:Uncharacterized protein n=1 Tax=Ilyodon furcidens TaxID=33524 RepID=A0ABV0SUZ8_9TELE